MKKGILAGWQNVFAFTWKQTVNGKGFKGATIFIALLFMVIGLAISTLMAILQKDGEEVSPISKVAIVDESGLEVLYLDSFKETNAEKYPDVTFVEGTEDASLTVKITGTEEGYLLTAIIPKEGEITKSDAEDFLNAFSACMEQSKLLSSGIPMEKLVLAMSGVSHDMYVAGEEEKSVGEELVSMLLPMIIVLIIYMLTLIYGQSIGNIVSVEKSSKLMEMILTMTQPYALLFGKIASTVVLAILQLMLWIVCFVGGFFGGDIIAREVIYPDYTNYILEVFELLRLQDGSTAFSPAAIVLCIFCMCLALLFYCVLSGAVASFASKAEELAQCMAYYQLAVIAGFFGAYILPLEENEGLNILMRIIPVSSAYLLPGDILVGNVNVGLGIVYMLILFAFTMALVLLAGKVYKNQLFHKGTNIFERFKKKKAK